MFQQERIGDMEEALRAFFDGAAAALWTALPGIVESYNAEQGTCVIQPAVRGRILSLSEGQYSWVNLPPLPNVPVVYMGGGPFVATFPIQSGDEALVVFSARCIDGWWQQGGVQIPPEIRMHDLSDGFAIIGPRSQARLIPNVSTTAAQLRSLDGNTKIELTPGGVVNIVAPGGLNVTGDITVNGKVTATGEGEFNQILVSQHEHSGVQPGSGISGPPVG